MVGVDLKSSGSICGLNRLYGGSACSVNWREDDNGKFRNGTALGWRHDYCD